MRSSLPLLPSPPLIAGGGRHRGATSLEGLLRFVSGGCDVSPPSLGFLRFEDREAVRCTVQALEATEEDMLSIVYGGNTQ